MLLPQLARPALEVAFALVLFPLVPRLFCLALALLLFSGALSGVVACFQQFLLLLLLQALFVELPVAQVNGQGRDDRTAITHLVIRSVDEGKRRRALLLSQRLNHRYLVQSPRHTSSSSPSLSFFLDFFTSISSFLIALSSAVSLSKPSSLSVACGMMSDKVTRVGKMGRTAQSLLLCSSRLSLIPVKYWRSFSFWATWRFALH